MNNVYKNLIAVLHSLVDVEYKPTDTPCNAQSSHAPYMSCSRVSGHAGKHIATGDEEVYEVWGTDVAEKDSLIQQTLDLIAKVVLKRYNPTKTCRTDYGPYGCCRRTDHNGPHIAIGSNLIALWDVDVRGN